MVGMRYNPDDPPHRSARGVRKHQYFKSGSKTVCTSAVLAAFGIDACSYHYSGQLEQRLNILRKNGWAARSRNSHINRGYRKLKMKSGTKSVGQARRIIAYVNSDSPEANAWGDPLGTRYMIRVEGHALLLDYHGNTIVDTDPRVRDRRKVLDIRAVFPMPERENPLLPGGHDCFGYRRNADDEVRELERRWRETGAPTDWNQYAQACRRAGVCTYPCSREDPAGLSHDTCGDCGAAICDRCSDECGSCGNRLCAACGHRCGNCDHEVCDECVIPCEGCSHNHVLCRSEDCNEDQEFIRQCDECMKYYCRQCGDDCYEQHLDDCY